MYRNFIKDVLDFILAFMCLMILLPLILLLIIILLLDNNGKVFFIQKRPGKNEKIFKIIKFKTMTDKKDSKGLLLPNSHRVTRVGLILRKYSLDEIPQLINVLKRDMSFVGPRPLRVRYLPFYTLEESIRHSVKPGITGLAQISGRNSLDWDDKFSLDIQYVNNISFKNDLIIILKTINKIFSNQDVDFETSNVIDDLDVSRRNCKKHNSKVDEI
ncbi:sugar transferase [Winogradskyella sp. KYW1333]|nr:sugar transferase [Winogradskyella sp. KYW1333]